MHIMHSLWLHSVHMFIFVIAVDHVKMAGFQLPDLFMSGWSWFCTPVSLSDLWSFGAALGTTNLIFWSVQVPSRIYCSILLKCHSNLGKHPITNCKGGWIPQSIAFPVSLVVTIRIIVIINTCYYSHSIFDTSIFWLPHWITNPSVGPPNLRFVGAIEEASDRSCYYIMSYHSLLYYSYTIGCIFTIYLWIMLLTYT